jgi:hypothetical protein
VEDHVWISRTAGQFSITSATFAPDGRSLAIGQGDLVAIEGMEGHNASNADDPKKRPKPSLFWRVFVMIR